MASDYPFGILDLWLLITPLVSSNFSCVLKIHISHNWWISPGTPASFTTKTGRHDKAEILLEVALNTGKIKSNQILFSVCFNKCILRFAQHKRQDTRKARKWTIVCNAHYTQNSRLIVAVTEHKTFRPFHISRYTHSWNTAHITLTTIVINRAEILFTER
jgi:hypothetical protein